MATRWYDVMHVNGDTYEVEADFFQREAEDWVFYIGQDEVFRVPYLDVVAVTKTPTWVRTEPTSEQTLWL